MKKLKLTFTGLLLVCLGLGVASAQANTTAGTPAKPAPAKKTTKKPAAAKAAAGTNAAKPAGPHMKKDGTPDKRYKENKTPGPVSSPSPKGGAKKPAHKKAATTAANKPM